MLLQQRPRHYRWRRRIFGGAMVAIAAVVWFGRGPVVRWYSHHRAHQALERARSYASKGDLPNAMLSVRIAMEAGTVDVSALRTEADILEDANMAEAVPVRQQILRLAPESTADRAACIRSALRFGDLALAESVQAGFSSAERDGPAALRAIAALRLAQRRTAEAETALTALAALEGADAVVKFELAALRLQSSDEATRSRSRTMLRNMAAVAGPMQPEANRELLRDAVARRDAAAAQEIAEQLARLPNASFDDQLRRLNVELMWPRLISPRIQAEVRNRAMREKADAGRFANWLLMTGRPVQAAAWVESLPEGFRTMPSVRTPYACALATLKRWPELAEQLKAGAWGNVLPDTIDAAMSARQRRDDGRTDDAANTWRKALLVDARRYDDLVVLARLAALWSLEKEYVGTLHVLAENFPDQTWPLRQLSAHLFQHGDTAGLCDLWALWGRLHPEERRIKADWILASLLLDHGGAAELAAEAATLCAVEPENAAFVRIHAFALWRQGDLKAALARIESLPLTERESPAQALYYGAMLAAAGRSEEASGYLARVKPAALMPEERRLFQQARNQIRDTVAVVLPGR